MPRRDRLDFQEAIQYVLVRGAAEREIFFEVRNLGRGSQSRQQFPHVLQFQRLLAMTRDECGAHLCAYCVLPNLVGLVLQTAGAPLQAFMQRLCGRYARYLRGGGLAAGGRVFAARYGSKVIAPEYLPHAVRRTHRSPIETGLCKQALDYPFSSDRVYRGEHGILPIDMGNLKTALEQKGHFGLRGYRQFMDQIETPYVEKLLSRGSLLDSRIVGNKVFVQRAHRMAATPPALHKRELLIAGVAELLKCAPAEIFSRTHTGTLGRALVAWYGVISGTATLVEMGQWFSVTGASLGQAIRVQRVVRPDLFHRAVAASDSTQP